MVSLLTRRLLREWKNLTRYSAHFADRRNVLFHLKPQDSNLHIWHLVLYDPTTSVELYLKLLIGSEEEPAIILKCLTPNELYPTNRNISLTHLNCLLIYRGLTPFLQHIWRHFFEKSAVEVSSEKSRLTIAWNRIICKDFKNLFPELLGTLAPGDYQLVKDHYRNTVNSQVESVTNTGRDKVEESCTTNNLIACDGELHNRGPVLKRRQDTSDSNDLEPSGKRFRR